MKCPKCHSDNSDTSHFCADCGTQLHPADDITASSTRAFKPPKKELTTGFIFAGRYQIVEELGKGGMGRVYRAVDKKLREEMALKLIKPEIASDKKTLERFSNELKLSRKISHRNVGRMYELMQAEGTHFITMEYVPGEDLKSFIRRSKRLDVGTAISIAKQICEGLAEAHRRGVIHRDLKPNNIMIDKEGNARIMDFGIARSIQAKGLTRSGLMIGTPEYMSPEQAEAEEVDYRSDIYSFGVILYEMVAGQLPFEGDTPLSVAMKHKGETPTDPKKMNPQIPEDLNQLILRCLEKNKENRYLSAAEVRSELVNIEKNIPTTDRVILKREPKTLKIGEITWKNLILYGGVVALMILLIVAGISLLTGRLEVIDSIAVLPFENASKNPEIESLSDGLTANLITNLSQLPNLKVISRFSVFQYKGKNPNLQEVSQELGVRAVLTGRIVERSDGLSINVELVDVKQNSVIWGEQYNQIKFTDIFSIQENIAMMISENLRLRLTGEEKQRLIERYRNAEVYIPYNEGRFYWNKRTEEGMKKSLDYFQKVIEIDPSYAPAYAGMADAYTLLARYSYISPEEAMPKAIAAAEQALEIDNMLGEAHNSLAFTKRYFEHDWEAAEREFKKAIQFNPGYATAHHWYALYLSGMGQHGKAIEEIKIAQELDPISFIINTNLAWIYYFAREYDKAIVQFQKTIDMNENFPVAHLRLGRAYLQNNMTEQAKSEFQKAITLSEGSTDMIAALGHAYAVLGEKDEAEDIIRQLENLSKDKYVSSYEVAVIYVGLGQKVQALDWLDKAYIERCSYMAYLKVDPRLDSLRTEPRFKALMRKMRLDY